MKRNLGLALTVALLVILSVFTAASAAGTEGNKYYLTDSGAMEVEHDTGFSKPKQVDISDGHYGWTLGRFVVTGFTDVAKEKDGTPVFLVNAGDSITLSYELFQNINRLNGRDDLSISDDTNGYDAKLQTAKPAKGLGRGVLFVRYTDYRNSSIITPHYHYLSKVQSKKGNIEISSLEEGDYELTLDYEIATDRCFPLSDWHDDYQVTAKFKVRNSNCMIFVCKNDTTEELVNYSVAENGFFLDYAGSRYLDVTVRREELTDNGHGRTLTVKENKAACDKKSYTRPGVYTIDVHNRYTNRHTTMTVSVGTDELTNAYVTSHCVYTPVEIDRMLADGKASITADWQLEVSRQTPAGVPVVLCATVGGLAGLFCSKRKKNEDKNEDKHEEE